MKITDIRPCSKGDTSKATKRAVAQTSTRVRTGLRRRFFRATDKKLICIEDRRFIANWHRVRKEGDGATGGGLQIHRGQCQISANSIVKAAAVATTFFTFTLPAFMVDCRSAPTGLKSSATFCYTW